MPQELNGRPMSIHTLSVLVENKPGVLARVSGLFSRRGFNIESLAVGPTEHPEISRITILVSVQGNALEQVTKQLNKLINVLKLVELEPDQAVQRELLLVKVRADETNRGSVVDIVELFNAKVVDVSPEALTIEMVGPPAKATPCNPHITACSPSTKPPPSPRPQKPVSSSCCNTSNVKQS